MKEEIKEISGGAKNYRFLLKTPLKSRWQKIGIKKRAGVVVPLFSIFSKNSLGIGEIPDLKLVIDWCQITKNSILQVLPLNDSGFDFSPFNCQSSFALDPVYLSLRNLKGIKKENPEKELKALAKKFPCNTKYVNYWVKKEKLKKLWQIFSKEKNFSSSFRKFIKKEKFWLEDYALFKTLKEINKEKSWEEWPECFKRRNKRSLLELKKKYAQELKFQKWLQWQLFEQLIRIRNYAKKNEIFLKGDLPFSVSRDSADVWSNPQYFKLNLASGAPPDQFSPKGQRWGYPPYSWDRIFKDKFIYFGQKLKYFQNFYHLFRIDHWIGLFRIWAIPFEVPLKEKGRIGFFYPRDEKIWQPKGEKILKLIIKNIKALPCAEDLGLLPSFSSEVLGNFGIPGTDVQRWAKNWQNLGFLGAQEYRKASVATLSTHDLSFSPDWWEKEVKVAEKEKFLKLLSSGNEKNMTEENLKFINSTASIFVILPIFEWLFLDKTLKKKLSCLKINKPGTISKKNFSLRMPISLEKLMAGSINNKIKEIISQAGRI